VERPAQFELFGQVINLGVFVGQLEAVAAVGSPDDNGNLPVRLEPAFPQSADPQFTLTRTVHARDRGHV